MFNFFGSVYEFFFPLYSASEVYSQPLVVNLDRDFNRYSFTLHNPGEANAIHQLFDLTIVRPSGDILSLRSFLGSDIYNPEDAELFKKSGFRQLNPCPSAGITLEHPTFPGWLIKKNYGYVITDGVRLTRTKAVLSDNLPRWMLTPTMIESNVTTCGIKVRNDAINPLRVVMLERGRQWINELDLTHLRTAHEYLYPLTMATSSTDIQRPLHDRVVVISRKEDILDPQNNVKKFAHLAEVDPTKLKDIAAQICQFITCNPLTDLPLRNIRFEATEPGRLFFIDGEPIGALANAYDLVTVASLEKFDPGLFSVLGLRNLQASITTEMQAEKVPLPTVNAVQSIFDEAIEKRIQVITWERKWQLFFGK